MKYFWYGVILLIGAILADGIIDKMSFSKKSDNSKRLECQMKSTTFERVIRPELIETLQKGIENNSAVVNINIDKAKYMPSRLFYHVKPEVVKLQIEEKIKTYNKNKIDLKDNITINVLIYENDKEDPGKKSEKAKLYAGYLVFSCLVNNQLAYKIQIDFMDNEGLDIPSKISCAIDSIMTLKENK